MTSSVFAYIGKFTVALVAYLSLTGIFGFLMNDEDMTLYAIWIYGALIYAITVMFLWNI